MRTVTNIYMTCLVLLLVCCSSVRKIENMQMESTLMEHNTIVSTIAFSDSLLNFMEIEMDSVELISAYDSIGDGRQLIVTARKIRSKKAARATRNSCVVHAVRDSCLEERKSLSEVNESFGKGQDKEYPWWFLLIVAMVVIFLLYRFRRHGVKV